ncbi:SKP1-like protein 1B-like [Trifolium pratense]|uniref:SKP1-like protein 1B-like n=1 Tax=Trifolium pratense TaxID=57577 RepID=A0A2K3P2T2_TRIPR|nr:SKP1-like protein 1B-like [Trifolium pratense]
MNHRLPSTKINLISSDGVIFEVDYGVAVELMSHRFEDIKEIIFYCKLSTKMLILIIEYCKVHKHNSGMMPFEVMDFDAQFVDVFPKTLLDLATSACYMKIDSLEKLTWSNCVVIGYF